MIKRLGHVRHIRGGRQPVAPRRKKVLATIGTGPMAPVLDRVLPTFEAYARRHDYRLVVGDAGDCQGRPPSWGKVALMRRLLAEADDVLWIDADAVILDDSTDLAAGMAPESYQGLVRHVTDNGEVPNAGVWFMHGDKARHLLEAVWQSEEYINHPWWENAALIDLLGYSVVYPIRPLHRTPWLQGTQWLSPKWNAVLPWVPIERPCIRHYAGWHWAGWSPDELVRRIADDLAGAR